MLKTAAIVFSLTVVASSPSQIPPTTLPAADIHERVRAEFKTLVDSEQDWRAAQAAKNELAAIGDPALSTVRRAAEHHENARVREACYSLLTSTFADDAQVMETVANNGLADPEMRIRYLCAFQLGEHKFFPGHRRLRIVFDDPKSDEFTRFAAAKSLAQLGEADVLRTLYQAVESDWYMHRYMGNLGLTGLTGKNLNDFEGYDYSEGAFVSGGREAVMAFDAVADSEKHTKRYSAMAAYFKWLKSEKPEVYKHVEPAN